MTLGLRLIVAASAVVALLGVGTSAAAAAATLCPVGSACPVVGTVTPANVAAPVLEGTGLAVEGTHLDLATGALLEPEELPLAVHYGTATTLQVILPAGITSGTHWLVLTSLEGSTDSASAPRFTVGGRPPIDTGASGPVVSLAPANTAIATAAPSFAPLPAPAVVTVPAATVATPSGQTLPVTTPAAVAGGLIFVLGFLVLAVGRTARRLWRGRPGPVQASLVSDDQIDARLEGLDNAPAGADEAETPPFPGPEPRIDAEAPAPPVSLVREPMTTVTAEPITAQAISDDEIAARLEALFGPPAVTEVASTPAFIDPQPLLESEPPAPVVSLIRVPRATVITEPGVAPAIAGPTWVMAMAEPVAAPLRSTTMVTVRHTAAVVSSEPFEMLTPAAVATGVVVALGTLILAIAWTARRPSRNRSAG